MGVKSPMMTVSHASCHSSPGDFESDTMSSDSSATMSSD